MARRQGGPTLQRGRAANRSVRTRFRPPSWTTAAARSLERAGCRPKRSFVIVRTAFVSTHPPRHCGIAAFTTDLATNTSNREVVVLHPPEQPAAPYPIEVHHRIQKDELSDYIRTAEALRRCVGIVSIQHEYGIWGARTAAHVIDFVRALEVPSVATLHTVLQRPTPGQRAVLSELVALTDATVVMSQSAAARLTDVYGIDRRRLHVIPHGVPELPFVDGAKVKPAWVSRTARSS